MSLSYSIYTSLFNTTARAEISPSYQPPNLKRRSCRKFMDTHEPIRKESNRNVHAFFVTDIGQYTGFPKKSTFY